MQYNEALHLPKLSTSVVAQPEIQATD